jgi:hypothetical protein
MSHRSESERAEERAGIMKRLWVLALVVVMAAAISAVVWAQQDEAGMERLGGGTMMGMGGGGMGGAAIAVSASNDIYVVHGGMVVKYDRDLNVLKQAELPVSERMMRGGGRMGGGERGGGGPRGGGGRRGAR